MNRDPIPHSYVDSLGRRVLRRSSDSVWPLRRANGDTWAEEAASAAVDSTLTKEKVNE
jgi:hypothetical protein